MHFYTKNNSFVSIDSFESLASDASYKDSVAWLEDRSMVEEPDDISNWKPVRAATPFFREQSDDEFVSKRKVVGAHQMELRPRKRVRYF